MEHQLFCKEGQDKEFYEEYKQKAWDFLLSLGLKQENLRYKDHDKLAFYAKAACDIQYNFPMGWNELNGIHNRTNHDLSRHQEYSGKNMLYMDPVTNEKYVPFVVEYSIGADRLMLAVLSAAYHEEKLEDGETRVVMQFAPHIAPYKAAVLPLIKKNHSEKARELHRQLSKHFMCDFDEAGSIGKRYRREDEVGTPFCITVDDDTLTNGTVTIRNRDTMKQDVVKLEDVKNYIVEKCEY